MRISDWSSDVCSSDLLRAGNPVLGAGLGLVIGGAVGNAIDRALYGAVVDFIDVHWGTLHWPAFNIADAAITGGVGLLLLDAFGIGTGARASQGGRTQIGRANVRTPVTNAQLVCRLMSAKK